MVTRLCFVHISCGAGCDTAWQVEEGPCFLCVVCGHSSDSGRMLWIQAVKHIRFDAETHFVITDPVSACLPHCHQKFSTTLVWKCFSACVSSLTSHTA